MHTFMKMEAQQGAVAPGPLGGGRVAVPQGDSPLSTHPAAANRLRRLMEAVGRQS